MAVATFDTLKFADTLKAGGVPPAQAEAQARAMAEVLQANFKELATKDDLDRAVRDLKRDNADESTKLIVRLSDESAKLTTKLSDATTRLSDELAKLNTKIEVVAAKNAADNYLTRWMLGAILSGVVAIVIRTFFMRPGP